MANKEVEQGNLAEALHLYNLVLEHQPHHPVATKGLHDLRKKMPADHPEQVPSTNPSQDQLNALIKLFHSGQLKKAEQSCKELLQTYPESLTVTNLFGMILGAQGRLQEAIQACDRAIQLQPDCAEAFGNRGSALQQLGRLQEAVDSYDAAIKFNPDYAEAFYNRGVALRNLGKLHKAVDSYDMAIHIRPDYSGAYYNRGNALQAMGQQQAAVQSYGKAIELQPDYSEAFCNQGVSLQGLGQLERAVNSYEKAIQLKPAYAEAHHNLSMLKEYQPGDAQIEVMESLHNDAQTNEIDRTRLSFAMGKVYEDLGDPDKFFRYLNEGNRLRKKALKYDAGDDRGLMAKIREIFSPGNSPPLPKSDSNAPISPLFIVGMPRSGTSLVEQILASHSKVHGAGELSAMDSLVSPILLNLPDMSIRQDKLQFSRQQIKRVRVGYLEALTALKVPEKVITDKMPLNFRWIGFIKFALPEAKIIHLSRDPRATCWSIYKRDFSFQGNGYAYDQGDLAEFYKLYTDLMSFWRERFPDTIYDICYEDLTENQEDETRKLLEFCTLQWEPRCLDFHKTKRVVHTASAAQVRKKMYQGSSDAWREFEAYLQPLIMALADF